MTTHSFARYGLTAVLLLTALAGGTVAAQENSTTTTPTPTGTPEPVAENVSVQLSPTLKITEWEYSSGTWRVTFDAKVPARITVTDAAAIAEILSEGSGPASGVASSRGYNLGPGKTTVNFEGQRYAGMAAVTIAASNSNSIAVLRTDALSGGGGLIKQSTAGLLVGVAVIGTGWGTYRRLKDRLDEESQEVSRHL